MLPSADKPLTPTCRFHPLLCCPRAPSIPQTTPDKPGKTPVADAVKKYFDNLEAMGKDPKDHPHLPRRR